ncbi:MAG TPA: hypothetical protein VJ890_17250 [Vineibacter sp.]|nr:hypothetical protein [Vineibacter sp.]
MALCTTAQAQFAPRATLDVVLPAAAGFKLALESPGAPLAIAADGTHYVLLHQFAPGAKPAEPAREAWVELLAVAADGALKWRRALPIRDKVTSSGLSISSLGVIAASAGGIVVVWSPNDPPEPRAPRSQIATMLRLGTDGTVRKASPIGPPSATRAVNDPAAYYELYVYRATPDNGVLLAGGYGSGPYAWWMGKFNLDGIRLWQAGPGNGFPERVASLERRLDGSWLGLVTEMVPRGSGLDWVIRRYAADGKLLRRTRLAPPVGQEVAVLRDGAVLVAPSEESATQAELVFVDDHGRVRRRTPWPFATTLRLIAAGDGLAAIVRESDAAEAPSFVVRADAQGVIRWRGPAVADVHSIVALPDGRIAALLRDTAEASALRLVRFTEP